jgi:hypothetical protein
MFSWAKKYCSVCTKKLHKMKVRKIISFESVLQIQQGLEIRGFWFQKKSMQRKTVLREVYTYVLNEI